MAPARNAMNTAVRTSPSRSLSERMNYPSMAGIVVATLLIAVPILGLAALVVDIVMILRYVFGYRAPGSPQWSIHHPSPVSLVVVWVVAVCTVVVYPLAIYMTVRYFIEYRDRRAAEARQCPRCAETVKAAALVCPYCGENLDPIPPAPAPRVATFEIAPVLPSPGGTTTRSSRRVVYVVGGLAAVVILGYMALIYAGSRVSGTLSPARQRIRQRQRTRRVHRPGEPSECVGGSPADSRPSCSQLSRSQPLIATLDRNGVG